MVGHQRTFKRVTATTGPNATAAISAAPEVELFKTGTLTIYGKCATDTSGPTTYGFVFAKTSQNGASLGGQVPVSVKNGTPPTGNGPYGTGDVCLFSGAVDQFN